MARPRKKTADKRTERLPHLRCTKGELAQIKTKADQAGLSLSDYLRKMASDGEVVVRQGGADFQLVDQLRRIGVNVNQMARRLNQTGKMPADLGRVWQRLAGLLDRVMLCFRI